MPSFAEHHILFMRHMIILHTVPMMCALGTSEIAFPISRQPLVSL